MIKRSVFNMYLMVIGLVFACTISGVFAVEQNQDIQDQVPGNIGFNVAGFNVNPKDVAQALSEVAEEAHRAGMERESKIMDAISVCQEKLSFVGRARIELGRSKDSGKVKQAEYDQKNKLYDQEGARIEEEIARLRKERDKLSERGDKLGDNIQAAVMGGIGAFTEVYKAEKISKETRITEIAKSAAQAAAGQAEKNKGALLELQLKLERLSDPRFLLKAGLFVSLTAAGVTGGYYGLKLLFEYIEAHMDKPTLVREPSRDGLYQWLKRLLFPVEQARKLEDIIVSPGIELTMQLLATDIFEAKMYGLPYQNALFYGPPGTGKTEMAKTLAYLSGMDYAIFSGADFAQFKNGQDVIELNKLFGWASASKKPLLIFIDEADACFRDRATLNKDGVDLVNAFLAQTGTSSDKFMIILATNYEDTLDKAVLSRIHKKVPFDLPAQAERYKILKLKIDKYIAHDARTYVKDGVTVNASLTIAPEITDSYLEQIAAKTDWFSGRDLDYSVSEMRMRAYRSGANVLTKDIVDYVINEKIKQVKKKI